jgi:hypothetical protein
MDTKLILTIMLAIFSTCATGFFFLALWLRNLSKAHQQEVEMLKLSMKDKVDFKWIETTFKPDLKLEIKQIEIQLQTNFDKLSTELSKISVVLVGDLDKKGIVTFLHEHSDRITKIEEHCEKTHG